MHLDFCLNKHMHQQVVILFVPMYRVLERALLQKKNKKKKTQRYPGVFSNIAINLRKKSLSIYQRIFKCQFKHASKSIG